MDGLNWDVQTPIFYKHTCGILISTLIHLLFSKYVFWCTNVILSYAYSKMNKALIMARFKITDKDN